MQYRCHECGNLFESPHTNYKFAKGFHPDDNPEHRADVAKDFDHCESCKAQRTHDPVAARTRDLASAMGPLQSDAISGLHAKIAQLNAQVEQAKIERAAQQDLGLQIQKLQADLASLKPVQTPPSQPSPSA